LPPLNSSIPSRVEQNLENSPVNPETRYLRLPFSEKIPKILFIKRSTNFPQYFPIGIFLALIIWVISKDIAFGWTTTHRYDKPPNMFDTYS